MNEHAIQPPRLIDVSGLPDLALGPRTALWWAMVLLLAIETMVFGTIVVSYFYIRMNHPEWPPAGIDPPKLLLPTLNTLLLIASSVPVHYGDKAIKKGDARGMVRGMLAAGVMALVFLVLKVIEYSGVPYRWDDHAYASIVWLTVGFHSAHVVSLLMKTAIVVALGRRGYFTKERHLGVEINGLYWHFVVAVWLPLYAVIYWAPRLLE